VVSGTRLSYAPLSALSIGRSRLPLHSRSVESRMAVRTVLRMGHPLLQRVAAPVAQFGTAELRQLVADMDDTMPRRRSAPRCAS
jgi:hypothetical protein